MGTSREPKGTFELGTTRAPSQAPSSPGARGRIERWLAGYAALALRRPWWLVLAGLAVFGAAAPAAVRLYTDLRTDLREHRSLCIRRRGFAVNLYQRYREIGPGGAPAALSTSGGAVALCSLTTILGYSALLVADNRAIFSFGLTAVLGEVACLSAALLALPALLVVRDWRRAAARAEIGGPPMDPSKAPSGA